MIAIDNVVDILLKEKEEAVINTDKRGEIKSIMKNSKESDYSKAKVTFENTNDNNKSRAKSPKGN